MRIKGCEYCGVDEAGDMDSNALIEKDITFESQLSSEMEDGSEISIMHKKDVSLYIGVCGNENCLYGDICDPIEGKDIVNTQVKINFCPMCGRKLSE